MIEYEPISNKDLIAAVASGKVNELILPEQFNVFERKKQCSRLFNLFSAVFYAIVFEALLLLVIGTPLYFLWGDIRPEFWLLGYFALVFLLYTSNQWGGKSQFNQNSRKYNEFYKRFHNASRAAQQNAKVAQSVSTQPTPNQFDDRLHKGGHAA
ncbi:MAG: hypothetical protein Q4A92_09140 [Corynebacterium sp.]|nr:hypothetical protein [Corynebacterium sp.]